MKYKLFSLLPLAILFSLCLESCYEPEETHSTIWFYSFEKYTFPPTIYVDGDFVGRLDYFISSASQISCDSELGVRHRVLPGTYYVEVHDYDGVPFKGGNITVDEAGKCYPLLVD